MRKHFKLTAKDLDNLFSGKVSYLVTHYDKIGYGWKPKWWEVIWWRITRPHCTNGFGYFQYFQYYAILTTMGGLGFHTWTEEDTQKFIKEKNLQDGDIVGISSIGPNDRSKDSYRCYSWSKCIVIGTSWKPVAKHLGA